MEGESRRLSVSASVCLVPCCIAVSSRIMGR
jgi:hypothetical protein